MAIAVPWGMLGINIWALTAGIKGVGR
jgi:hypothetical protein